MTAEKRAENLLEKMIKQGITREAGKKCALLAVDEILNNDGFTRHDEYLTQYWQDVEKALNAL